MELKILHFVLYIKILSDLGKATKIHLHPPPHLYPVQIFPIKQINENITGISFVDELWKVKDVSAINNPETTSTEKLIFHQISVDVIEEESDKLQEMFEKTHNAPSDQNLSTVLPQLRNSVEEELMVILNLKEKKKNNIRPITTNTIPSLGKTLDVKTIDYQKKGRNHTNITQKDKIISACNSTSQFPEVNENSPPKQESINLLPTPFVQNYSENLVHKKSNQNIDENVIPNSSEVNGTQECCIGKHAHHVYSLDTLSTRLEDSVMEEDKLTDKLHNITFKQGSIKFENSTDIKNHKSDFSQIRFLASNLLQSLNTKHISGEQVNNISITEAISRSRDMFELVENLNRILNLNKEDIDDPSGLVKTVVGNQIEKCHGMYDESKIKHSTHNKTLAKIENNKKFMNFMKCVNVNLKICLTNFTLWLKTRKFYLRPQFKISKAFKTFERIYSLSCS